MDKPNRVETVQRACKIFISGMFFLLFPLITLAENASLAFGGKDVAADAPIEITSESLEVNQSDGTVVFSGDVLITQGALRLSAAKVLVSYDNDTSMIATINASDGVVLDQYYVQDVCSPLQNSGSADLENRESTGERAKAPGNESGM